MAVMVEPAGWLKGAKDALVIADQARVRRGISLRRPQGDELAWTYTR
jgi:hypothetical protein